MRSMRWDRCNIVASSRESVSDFSLIPQSKKVLNVKFGLLVAWRRTSSKAGVTAGRERKNRVAYMRPSTVAPDSSLTVMPVWPVAYQRSLRMTQSP